VWDATFEINSEITIGAFLKQFTTLFGGQYSIGKAFWESSDFFQKQNRSPHPSFLTIDNLLLR